jgi:hypothetical protein
MIYLRLRQLRKRGRQDEGSDAQANQDHSFQPIRFPVLHDVVDRQDGQEEHDRLERVKEHRKRTTDDPAKDDGEWDDKQRDLLDGNELFIRVAPERRKKTYYGTSNSDAYAQRQLILYRNRDSRYVLSGITDNGEQDQTNELLRDPTATGQTIDRIYKPFSSNRDKDRDHNQETEGHR